MPAGSWDAVLKYVRNTADAARLADGAGNPLLYRYAIPLYRRAADAGDSRAAGRLAELLARRGDIDGLRTRADAAGSAAARRLAGLLAKRGDLEGLRTRADTGDHQAAGGLAELLTMRGQGEEAERLCRFGLEPDGSIALCVKGRPASSPQHVRNNTGESDAACLSLIVSRIEGFSDTHPARPRS